MKKIGNWKLEIGNLEKEIVTVISYFFFFNYPPTSDEIYCFLKIKASKRRFMSILEKMVENGDVKACNIEHVACNIKTSSKNVIRYILQVQLDTVGEYSIPTSPREFRATLGTSKIQNYKDKYHISQNKLKSLRFRLYVKFLSLFPQIKLIGLSGSVAMLNAKKNDDIDLFIITAKKRLFTGRFLALVLAQIIGIRRKWSDKNNVTTQDKVCLNLFFDESNLSVPDFKKTEYVAHEVLQMNPLVVKGDIYERFLEKNKWVNEIFPNAKEIVDSQLLIVRKIKMNSIISNQQSAIINYFSSKIETLLRNLQLRLINRHKTTEIITDSQFWFHPEDFGQNTHLWSGLER